MCKTTVIRLPVSDQTMNNSTTRLVPVLFILDGINAGPMWELSAYLYERSLCRDLSERKAQDLARNMCRLIELGEAIIGYYPIAQRILAITGTLETMATWGTWAT